MYKYKFLNILDSLDDKEFKTLGKFIASPFFNESKKMVELYEFVKKYYHNHTFKELTTELISEGVFKTKKYDSARTRKLVSDFNILVENFLIHKSVDRDLIGKKIYLVNQLKKKELDKFYNIEIDDLKRIIKISDLDSKKYYLSSLNLAIEELFIARHSLHRDKKIEKIGNLIDSTERLNIFLKLNIYHLLVQNNLYNDKEIFKSGLDSIEDFINNIQKKADTYKIEEPKLYLYYFTLKLILSGTVDKIFPEIENYIEENKAFLDASDIVLTIYTIVIFVVNEISSGRFEKAEVAVRIFKRIDEKGYFTGLKEINHFIFAQIINFALSINDIEYAEAFLWRYFPKIKIYKDDSINLAIASLRFSQYRYNDAKDHIKKIKYKTFGFYLFANSLLLKIFYEENSLKFINPLVDSFKHFLKRNKNVPGYFSESYYLFLTYLTGLTSLKKKNRKDIFKFEYELSNEKKFIDKKWIEEKVKEIIMINESPEADA